jgi:hypothetical protein
MKRPLSPILIVLATCCALQAGDSRRPEISNETRHHLVRLINAEYAWVKQSIPKSQTGMVIHPDGKMDPHGRDMALDLARYGALARPGERVQITSIEIKDKKIYLELNGGPVKRSKWYQRISVGGMGGQAPVAAQPDNSRSFGTSITVEFKKHVPEMTPDELKQILSPLMDFSVKSAAQAYTESLPKNVQEAIKDHRILVGMNKEMVTYSKGRPPKRLREKDEHGNEYEEWIYGQPPEDVEFVRFTEDEVTQLKVMKVGGEKIVKTEKEVILQQEPTVAKADTEAEKPLPKPANAPTLRRPGEAAPQPNGPDNGIMTIPPPGDQPQINIPTPPPPKMPGQ